MQNYIKKIKVSIYIIRIMIEKLLDIFLNNAKIRYFSL